MTTKLGPWPLGIDNRSGRGALMRNQDGVPVSLSDAANVNIDRAGRPARRSGQVQVEGGARHSLWAGALGAFGCIGNQLCRATVNGLTPLTTLNSADPCTYAVLNDAVLVANRATLLRIRGGEVREAGLPDAAAPLLQPSSVGGLYAGRYAVAVAALVGQEVGGLSPIRTVTVPENGGISLTAVLPVGATGLRVYRSRMGGGALYRCDDLPTAVDDYLLGDGALGAEESTRGLRKMPPGEFVATWNGRVLVGHGRTLYVGEPMRYGLYSPRHGFVQFAEPITFVAPVDAGVFVGLASTVVLLRGSVPKDWTQEFTGAAPPVPRSASEIEPDEHGMDAPGSAVLWLSRAGYVIGTAQGQIVAPQSSRLRLPAYAAGATAIHNRRVLTSVS